MSYVVAVYIFCDYPGCANGLQYRVENAGGMNKTWAAYRASREGWQVRGRVGSSDPKVAYCPEHRTRPPVED